MNGRTVVPLLCGGLVLLLLNSAYLAGRADPTIAYYAQVAIHPLLGLALAALAASRFARSWNATRFRAWTAATLAAGAVLGIGVLIVGATRPYYALVQAHVGLAVAGIALLSIELWRIVRVGKSWVTAVLTASIALVIVAAAVAALARLTHEAQRARQFRIVNGDAPPAGPFFPSPATTSRNRTIPADYFMTSTACGRCHRDIYEQWNSSMHHLASFNNQWYRKSIEYMQEVVGIAPSKWCAGCHDHALLFSGRFDRPVKDQIETPAAQAGLSCTSCHAITRVHGTLGQGGIEIEYLPLHDLAASDRPLRRAAHDKLLALAPRPHRAAFIKPFHREQASEFCSSCHKVHLDVPVNSYRWLRGFNDYDNWQASGVSGEGARSFYYPPRAQTCTDCHMPLVSSSDPAARNGRVRSHRFAAANTAVPFVNGDEAQLDAVQRFLRDGQVTIDVFGLVPVAPIESTGSPGGGGDVIEAATTFAVGEESFNPDARQRPLAAPGELRGPFGATPVTVVRGESVRLEVVVRTRKVGHFFPGGTVDAFDVWVEVEARDERGRTLLHSGGLEPTGAVEPGAHRYRSLLLDGHGNPINKRNAWAARSVAYVRLIPPGAADTIHYRLEVPPDAGDTISITARLKYRKFAWWNTQWAYAGLRDPKQPSFALAAGHDDGGWVFTGDTSRVSGRLKAVPELPVTELAVSHATLTVLPEDAPRLAVTDLHPTLRERWNDYGIGLLLQGDIRGAEAAFLRVTGIDPAYADGWVNVGRARIQEGNMAGAEQMLRKALAIDPTLAKTHFFLGTVLRARGQYDEALAHFRRAAAQYPRDRVVLNQIGRVLFLQRQYQAAIVEFRQVLAIDTEDLQAHYNLMLCYQGLADTIAAEKERVLYERLKADEASQAIAGEYRRLNAHDNNERQPIHEHRTMSQQ